MSVKKNVAETPPAPEPEAAVVAAEPEVPSGSLWQEDSPFQNLFASNKARKVGDIVTVRIVESSSASNGATTQTSRESSLSAGLEKFLGLESRFSDSSHPKYEKYPKFNPFSKIAGGLTTSFDGSGSTKRSGKLTAVMSARIAEALPNGTLRIFGSREVRINNETQLITLTGFIRPADISNDNVVLSTYIADARISYSGSGVVQNHQRPGWLVNLLNVVWPF